MTRLCGAALAVLVILSGAPAQAGDLAQRAVIGFSPDGRYFGFEEFGRQDGSGFPYANIFLIDIERDAWVEGSPQRVVVDNEGGSIVEARDRARRELRTLIQQLNLTEPGETVATNIFTHENADARQVTAYPRLIPFKTIEKALTFKLDVYAAQGDPRCEEFSGDRPKGFRLTMSREDAPRVLHEDERIPKTRNCPLDYRIHDVVTFYPDGGTPVLAVIIQVMQIGYEGPDGRFLAVTARL